MNRLLLIGVVLIAFHAVGQKFADKTYYLVDSLVYETVSEEYQLMIDNNLKFYHTAQSDVERIYYVNQIVKLCWDQNVWPKYNKWVLEYTTEKLKEPQTDTVRYQMKQAQAGALYYIGWNFSVETDYDQCIAYYEKCKDIYIEIADSIGIANTLDNIGGTYVVKGEYAKALDYHMRALAIREKIEDVVGMGASLNSAGALHLGHGDYASALVEFERALKFHQHAQFVPGISTSLTSLGAIESYLGNYDKALDYHEQSMAIREQLGDKKGIATSLVHIGEINVMRNDTTSALEQFKKSLSLYEEIGNTRGKSGVLCHLGFMYLKLENYDIAKTYFGDALRIAMEIGASIEKRRALVGLFDTYVMLNDLDEAEKHIIEIINMRRNDVHVNFAILPEKKKELYFSTMSEDFMNLYAFASIRKEQNPLIVEMAYDNALKLKGLLLKSTTAMRESILTSGDPDLIDKYIKWIDLKKQIAELYATGGTTESAENLANGIEKDLIKSSTVFRDFNKTNDLDWKDVQSHLKPGEAAVEFIHFNDSIGNANSPVTYAALIVTPNSKHPEMINLCTKDELEKVLGTTQSNNISYINKVYGSSENTNLQLYSLIWKPLEEALREVTTVYFSPAGLLHKVSFSALSNANNSFLCDKYHLIQVGSTGQLVVSEPYTFAADGKATLFGGVNYDTEKTQHEIWSYLPGTLDEVDSIYSTLKGNIDVQYFTKEQASEENFKKIVSESNYLHIATHGFFYPDPELVRKEMMVQEDEELLNFRGGATNYGIWNFVSNENPLMRSGIALAGANDMWDRDVFEEGEDGVLTAQEVTTLNMHNTDLVVLSACETGLGDIKGSEGVYGLQRAFKMAGVKYLIMSLWQVPDRETAEFMTLFYNKLLEQKNIEQAFEGAQKEMRVKYDPYYWAAFVLIE